MHAIGNTRAIGRRSGNEPVWCLPGHMTGLTPRATRTDDGVSNRDLATPLAPRMYQLTQHTMELHSVDARKNRARRYLLVLTLDPASAMPYRVTSQWGREGSFLRGESYQAPDKATALAMMCTLLKRRRAHGYSVIAVDDDHPLASWLVDENYPKESPAHSQTVLFDMPLAEAVEDPMQGFLFQR